MGEANLRHVEWANNLDDINSTVNSLGKRALRKSGGDLRKAEELFEKYLGSVESRLRRVGSNYGVEIQPTAIKVGQRVPAGFNIGGKWIPYKGSGRLDAGIVDLSQMFLHQLNMLDSLIQLYQDLI